MITCSLKEKRRKQKEKAVTHNMLDCWFSHTTHQKKITNKLEQNLEETSERNSEKDEGVPRNFAWLNSVQSA
jgi:hypothetical protein